MAGDLKRSPREIKILSTMVLSEYSNNFCQINDKRVKTFFIQLQADCFNLYSEKMQNAFDAVKTYIEETNLKKLHDRTKKKSYAQVCLISVFPIIEQQSEHK